MYGNVSEDAGSCSDTINRKTANDSSTVTSNETFSPDSGGNTNPKAATEPVKIQGNKTVKT